jgi:hypothetical protein
VSAAIQLALDVRGYALPLDPEALAELSAFEVGHICSVLRLDEEQVECVEAAVAAVLAGEYGGGR